MVAGVSAARRGYCGLCGPSPSSDWGGRDALELLEVEPPPVAPDGVLVRVRAASLNPVDYKVREGKLAGAFPYHFPVILGWDAAGVVEAVGPGGHVVQARRPGLRLLPPP